MRRPTHHHHHQAAAASPRGRCLFLLLLCFPALVGLTQMTLFHAAMFSSRDRRGGDNYDARGDVIATTLPEAKGELRLSSSPPSTSSPRLQSHPPSLSATPELEQIKSIGKRKCPREGVLAFTYASHHGSDDRFCRSLESAARHGIHLNILGWMVPWKGLAQKITGTARAVEALEPGCLALFNDAYDIIYDAPLEDIRDAYHREFPSNPILFSAECGCWPQIANPGGAEACNVRYPSSPTRYRFLNSGQWMSRAVDAAYLLNWIVNSTKGYSDALNDQELLSNSFARGVIPNLKLDVRATIFQSMHDNDDAKLPVCTPSQDVVLASEEMGGASGAAGGEALWRRRRWVNRAHGTRPSIFHFNGSGKRRHLSMEQPLVEDYARGARRLDLNAFLFELPDAGKQITFGEICPGHIPG